MPRVVIAFGSNRGDRMGFLELAVRRLRPYVSAMRVSPIYETAPMYVEDQPAFLNGVLVGHCELGPLPLLRVLKGIEAEVGRSPTLRYGPREIDLDLIGYGCLAYTFTQGEHVVLQVPHPRTPERRFVLRPMADLDSGWLFPGQGGVELLLSKTEDQADSVVIYNHGLLSV